MNDYEKQKEFFNQKVRALAMTKMTWGKLMTYDYKPHPESGLSQEEMEQIFARCLTYFANLLHARRERYKRHLINKNKKAS